MENILEKYVWTLCKQKFTLFYNQVQFLIIIVLQLVFIDWSCKNVIYVFCN